MYIDESIIRNVVIIIAIAIWLISMVLVIKRKDAFDYAKVNKESENNCTDGYIDVFDIPE